MVALPLDEASAKLRTGPPKDDDEDLALACWAGELPLRLVALEPVPDPQLRPGLAPGDSVTAWRRGSGRARS